MSKTLQTNVFPITNFEALTSEYRLFEVRGMNPNVKGYQRNKQYLINSLSRSLRHPITVFQENEKTFLVTKNEDEILDKLPTEYGISGDNTIYIEDTGKILPVNFSSQNPRDRKICLRFLQFSLQGHLFRNSLLWQPRTGKPFFEKKPEFRKDVAIYTGFSPRILDLGAEGWGVTFDVTKKYAKRNSIPVNISKKDFDNSYRGKRFIYKFGESWYEIKLVEWNNINVSEYKYPDVKTGESITLLNDLRKRFPTPHPKVLADLPENATVLIYYKGEGDHRGAPAGLCFEILSTDNKLDRDIHRNSIIKPDPRLGGIYEFRDKYLKHFNFGGVQLEIGYRANKCSLTKFDFPDYYIGDNEILLSRNFRNPKELANARMHKVNNSNCGYYKSTQPQLSPQYILLPRSIFDTMGGKFIELLKESVNKMYPWDHYSPIVEWYEDKGSIATDYVGIGVEILESIKSKIDPEIPSNALVMIPSMKSRRGKHDELGAMITRELKKIDLDVSIIHTNVLEECFEEGTNRDGNTDYFIRSNKKGKLRGYVNNVSNAKILINNNKYPFILKTPLVADMTIGIDVKNNTAGFVFVDKFGKNIRPVFVDSIQGEKLTKSLTAKTLYRIIKDEVKRSKDGEFRNFVFHRDGRLFESERLGICVAFDRLIKEGILNSDVGITILEIPKNSLNAFRIFEGRFNRKFDGDEYFNPPIGSYFIANKELAFICTTGSEFNHDGTTYPLCVKYLDGSLPFEAVLKDLFFLSTLAYTKVDDCSRLPITIKILDMKLRTLASRYDKKRMEFIEFEDLEGFEELKSNFNFIKPKT